MDYINRTKDVNCADCLVKYPPECMQFDHLPQYEKSFNIGLMKMSVGLARLQLEMNKCEVVCANCHALRTSARRKGVDNLG